MRLSSTHNNENSQHNNNSGLIIIRNIRTAIKDNSHKKVCVAKNIIIINKIIIMPRIFADTIASVSGWQGLLLFPVLQCVALVSIQAACGVEIN